MQIAIVTNCTARKRNHGDEAVTPAVDEYDHLDQLAPAWLKALHTAAVTTPVGELYAGRSVVEAAAVAKALGAKLHFVSAGLGLVEQGERWPRYNLTVSKGYGSIAPFLLKHHSTSADWWRTLNAAKGDAAPLVRLLESSADLVLLALPSGYLKMVSEDIGGATKERRKLRIFSSEEGRRVLDDKLAECFMSYDERLEGAVPGTKADFPQRALRHFVMALGGHLLPLAEARAAVSKAMAALHAPTTPKRTKATDSQIIQLLQEQWQHHGGHSSRLLRYLRDDAQVACEQGRFRDLWHQVKAQQDGEGAHTHG